MNVKVRTFELGDNTYYLATVCKTSYEQRQERKAERNYMILQKGSGIAATILSIVLIANGAIPALLLTLVGLAVTLTKDHVIG